MTDLSKKIREIRDLSGLSQAAFAAEIGVSTNKIQNIESGKQRVDHEFLRAIAVRFTVDLNELVAERAAPAAPRAAPQIDPIRLMVCRTAVAEEYQAAERPLPQDLHFTEAVWAYNEILSRVSDPNDGDEMEAVMPQVRHLLRKRIKQGL